jgi:(1->4)-alpha-D-glucan 1-alpha-D-glucosylmutase
MQARAQTLPHGMTATATHDTKRGEDARMRILALSELGDDWGKAVRQWRGMNANHATWSDSVRAPSPSHEYMLYQALLGAWPVNSVDQDFIARMQAYAVKAAREGKELTSWVSPKENYEKGLTDFLAHILDRSSSAPFLDSFDAFAQRAALLGALNSLTQTTIKAMMPGVPDFYQGTEFWDLSLVDPDNRRPVDFSVRSSVLAEISENPDWRDLAQQWQDGRIKLALTRQLLAIRNRFEPVFTNGNYQPLEVIGPQANEVVAFSRSSGRDTVIVAVGRLFARATNHGQQWPSHEAWAETVIRIDSFSSVQSLLGAAVPKELKQPPISTLFGHLPIAILHAESVKARKPRVSSQFAVGSVAQ